MGRVTKAEAAHQQQGPVAGQGCGRGCNRDECTPLIRCHPPAWWLGQKLPKVATHQRSCWIFLGIKWTEWPGWPNPRNFISRSWFVFVLLHFQLEFQTFVNNDLIVVFLRFLRNFKAFWTKKIKLFWVSQIFQVFFKKNTNWPGMWKVALSRGRKARVWSGSPMHRRKCFLHTSCQDIPFPCGVLSNLGGVRVGAVAHFKPPSAHFLFFWLLLLTKLLNVSIFDVKMKPGNNAWKKYLQPQNHLGGKWKQIQKQFIIGLRRINNTETLKLGRRRGPSRTVPGCDDSSAKDHGTDWATGASPLGNVEQSDKEPVPEKWCKSKPFWFKNSSFDLILAWSLAKRP